MKGIGSRTFELWSEFFQQACVRQQLVLDLWVQRIKFRLEFGVEKYLPRHRNSMYYESYVVKCILLKPMCTIINDLHFEGSREASRPASSPLLLLFLLLLGLKILG